MKESQNVLLSVGTAGPTHLWVKLAMWETLEMNHLKDSRFQCIMLSTKGYFRDNFNNWGKFSESYYIFSFWQARKKKIAGSQMFASLKRCHFHPGNVCLDSLGRNVSGLQGVEAIFSTWLYFEKFIPFLLWMITTSFSYSFRSEMSPSQEKSNEFHVSKTGTQQIGYRVLGKGCVLSAKMYLFAAVIFQEPQKVQAVKHQITSQVMKGWVLKGSLFRKARTHQHRDIRVRTHREVGRPHLHACLKPKPIKI